MANNSPYQNVRQILIAEKTEILRTQGSELDRISNPANRIDGSDVIFQRETPDVSISVLNNQKIKLQQISNALLGIKNGTYGTCKDCHEPIPSDRLEIIPHAQFCIGCQSARE